MSPEVLVALDVHLVCLEREGGVTFLVLNRPEKRNALSPQHCNDIVQALTDLETDAETQVLVLTGAGEAFCAGMDLREFFRALDDDPNGRHRAQQAAAGGRLGSDRGGVCQPAAVR